MESVFALFATVLGAAPLVALAFALFLLLWGLGFCLWARLFLPHDPVPHYEAEELYRPLPRQPLFPADSGAR